MEIDKHGAPEPSSAAAREARLFTLFKEVCDQPLQKAAKEILRVAGEDPVLIRQVLELLANDIDDDFLDDSRLPDIGSDLRKTIVDGKGPGGGDPQTP